METNIRIKKKNNKILTLPVKTISIQTSAVSTMYNSFTSSHLPIQPDIENIANQEIRAKASILLSLPLTPRIKTTTTKKYSIRDSKLSLMHSPKKRLTNHRIENQKKRVVDFTERTFNNKVKQGQVQLKENSKQQISQFLHDIRNFSGKQADYQKDISPSSTKRIDAKRIPGNLYSLSNYFQLVFSKMLSKGGKQKILVLIKQLSQRYLENPGAILQDVLEVKTLSEKLLLALGPKQTYKQLRPFEALEVDGQLPRLFFHLTHQITTRKNRKYDLAKIYKQIQYCSRRLKTHRFTMRVCFELGEIYKQRNEEINSHAHFVKAFKMAIFLNDKYNEEKAIDCLGLNAFISNKTGEAIYFHQNISKLNSYDREKIRQKYSNEEQLENIQNNRLHNQHQEFLHLQNTINKKKEIFKFDGAQFTPHFETKNRLNFKENVNKLMRCPQMKSSIFLARKYMTKISQIGKITRFKQFQTSRVPNRFEEDFQSSSEILMSHRSLNRRDPQADTKSIEREAQLLRQLISFYANQNLEHLQGYRDRGDSTNI